MMWNLCQMHKIEQMQIVQCLKAGELAFCREWWWKWNTDFDDGADGLQRWTEMAVDAQTSKGLNHHSILWGSN